MMYSFPTEINTPALTGKSLTHWQVATDGLWEEALELHTATPGDIDSWLKSASEDVAIEAFFNDDHHDFFFIGLRLTPLSASDKARFLHSVTAACPARTSFTHTIDALRQAAAMPELFTGPVDMLEIGVEGLWKTVGPYSVWKNTDGGLTASAASPQTIQTEAPRFFSSQPRPIMLEFGRKTPLVHWIGLQVCQQIPAGGFVFDTHRYTALTTGAAVSA